LLPRRAATGNASAPSFFKQKPGHGPGLSQKISRIMRTGRADEPYKRPTRALLKPLFWHQLRAKINRAIVSSRKTSALPQGREPVWIEPFPYRRAHLLSSPLNFFWSKWACETEYYSAKTFDLKPPAPRRRPPANTRSNRLRGPQSLPTRQAWSCLAISGFSRRQSSARSVQGRLREWAARGLR